VLKTPSVALGLTYGREGRRAIVDIRLRPFPVLPPGGSLFIDAPLVSRLPNRSRGRLVDYEQTWRHPQNRKYIGYRNAYLLDLLTWLNACATMMAAQVSMDVLQKHLSSATRVASTRVKFAAAWSYLTLSNHFFLGLPLVRDPSVRPNNAIRGNLSAGIRDTCPKSVSRRIRRSSVISLSVSNVFIMSTFRFLSRRFLFLS